MIGEYLTDSRVTPTIRMREVGFSNSAACPLENIHTWGYDFFSGEDIADSHNAYSACVHFEYPFNDGSCFGIGNQFLFVFGIPHIAVWRCGADSFASFTLSSLHGSYFSACVTGIEIVEVILDSRKIADTVDAVHAIVYGNKTHIVLWEGYLHQHSRLQIISAESGLVFYNNDSDLSAFHISHESFEIGAVEVCTRISVIDIKANVWEAVFLGVLLQYQFLIGNAVGFALLFILLRQTAVKSSY